MCCESAVTYVQPVIFVNAVEVLWKVCDIRGFCWVTVSYYSAMQRPIVIDDVEIL